MQGEGGGPTPVGPAVRTIGGSPRTASTGSSLA
jgi:hypothetical protein